MASPLAAPVMPAAWGEKEGEGFAWAQDLCRYCAGRLDRLVESLALEKRPRTASFRGSGVTGGAGMTPLACSNCPERLDY